MTLIILSNIKYKHTKKRKEAVDIRVTDSTLYLSFEVQGDVLLE